MIKHTELRCGNLHEYYIEDHADERKAWWEVSVIDPDDLKYLQEHPEDESYRFIPLSEEWLLRAGFKNKMFTVADDDGVLRDKMAPNKEYFDHDKLPKEVSLYLPYNHFSYHIGSVRVEYVHQLQNLYFALTGLELTFKDLDQ